MKKEAFDSLKAAKAAAKAAYLAKAGDDQKKLTLKPVADRLNEYLGGKVEKIEELESPALPAHPSRNGKYIQYNGYHRMMSAGII